MMTYRRVIAASHHFSWKVVGRRKLFDIIWVSGFPKSGTTWMTQLISAATGLPYPRLALLPVSFDAVLHGHSIPKPHNRPMAYIHRDGRECLLARYRHDCLKSKEEPNVDGFRAYAETALDSGYAQEWSNHVLTAHREVGSEAFAWVGFADLKADTETTLATTLQQLGRDSTAQQIELACLSFDRSVRSALPVEGGLVSKADSKIPINEWFGDALYERFTASSFAALSQLGYV